MHPPDDRPTAAIHIATFQLNRADLVRVLWLPGLALVVGVVLVVVGLLASMAVVLSALGGFVAARSAVFLWQQSSQWGLTSELRSDGLVRRSGQQERLIPFSHMREVNTTGGDLAIYPVEFVHIFTTEREHFVYAGWRGFEFGRLLRLEHATVLAPAYLAQLQRGEPVRFGSFAITPEGVQRSTRRVPWRNIDDVRLYERNIELLLGGNWRPLARINQVPNARVFVDVLQQANRTYSPPAQPGIISPGS